MVFKVYEEMAKDLTAENALDVCKNLLQQAQSDSVEYDAEIKKLTEQIEDGKAKYNDLQVDYIKRFTAASKPDDEAAGNDPDELTDEKVAEMIAEAVKGA